MRIEINDYIIVDSEICHGKPVFKNTRIMVWQVLELLGSGITIEEIIKNYFPQLNKEAIFSVLNYASKLVEDEKYVLFQ
ncbi:DUF433 domain-containing protein [Candidatus Pacearchaeota archaeon]|nr:DUF433 domain-containing protein [Candidatus Pacearchaeota archaeon]